MARMKATYDEITRCKISGSRNAVISACSTGGYTIAQQLETKEADGAVTRVFLRGALHVADLDALRTFRDAVDLAIHGVEMALGEARDEDDVEWD